MRRAAVLFITVFVLIVFSAILLTNSITIVQRVARVSNVRGSVELQAPSDGGYKPVTQDCNARAGSILRTGADGRATLWWADGTTIRVGPNSTLTIDKCRFDRRRASMFSHFTLSAGRVWVHVVKMLSAESKFEISTPTATAGVRGTAFAMNVAADGATSVLVYDGLVEVRAGSKVFDVKAGKTLAIARGGSVSLRELSDRERAEGQEALAETSSPAPVKSGAPASG